MHWKQQMLRAVCRNQGLSPGAAISFLSSPSQRQNMSRYNARCVSPKMVCIPKKTHFKIFHRLNYAKRIWNMTNHTILGIWNSWAKPGRIAWGAHLFQAFSHCQPMCIKPSWKPFCQLSWCQLRLQVIKGIMDGKSRKTISGWWF